MSNAEDFGVATAAVQGKHNGDACIPEFRIKAVLLEAETEQAGKPIYRNVEYVTIHIPGDLRSTVDRKVTQDHRDRWPVQYAKWKQGLEIATDGVPLEKWSLIGPAEVETFKFFKVRTVEQLAELSDTQVQNLGRGAVKLRKEAIAYLAQAKGNAGISKAVADNERLEIENARLKRELQDALARLAAVKSGGEDDDDQQSTMRSQVGEPGPARAKRGGRKPKAVEPPKSALDFEQSEDEIDE